MNTINYNCQKCGHKQYEIDQIRATGGVFSKLFDIQTKKFTSVTCKQCTYTEFFKTKTSALSNVFDFFTN